MQENTPQPGWTYKPGDDGPSVEPQKSPVPVEQAATPIEANSQPKDQPASAEPATVSKPEQPTPPYSDPNNQAPDQSISWTASEFVANHKNAGWYLLFLVGLALCAGLIYLISKDIISSVVVGVAGVLFAILASHKPRQLAYRVDNQGVTIASKFYPYTLFKSFGVSDEGAIGCVNLMPLKRFMPELSIYYPPEEEEKILSVMADHLPHEEHQEHSVDKLLKKIRF